MNEEMTRRSRVLRSSFFILPSALCILLFSSCVFWTPRTRTASPSALVIPNVPVQKWDILTCGAGSLSSVLQHHGDTTTMDEWQAALPKTRGGVMSIDLVLAARQKGFDARLITGDRATVEQELRSGRPVILMLQVIQTLGRSYDFFHYIVLDGIDDTADLVRAQFGDGKVRWIKFERLEKAWKPVRNAAIFVQKKDPASELLRAAVTLEEQGKVDAAITAYRELLARHPESVVGWTNLGNAQSRLDLKTDAEASYRKALALDARSRDTLNNLAWLLFEEKRFDEAETHARTALAIPGPDSYLVLDTLARILAAKGSCEEASKRFREAIDAVPQSRAAERLEIEKTAKSVCHS
jgi:predicted negative regulator of RcsB-dependent stress response